MFQNGQKVVVVASGDERRVIKVQSASGTPDPSRYPIVTTDGVTGRDQQVQVVSGGDATRFPILRGVTDARGDADAVITALSPAAWYRNATGVTSAGGFASQWDDYSGNARHLVQATGTNQPAYAAGVFTFDGLDNFMDMTDAALIQPVTVYAVLNQKTWAASDRLFDGAAVNTCFVQQSATAASPNIRSFGGGAYSADLADLAVNTRAILACSYAGASSSVRVNNNAAITGNYGSTAIGGLTLGASGTPSLYGNVAYEEFVMFLADHDDTTQSSVITALNNALTVF